MSTTSNKISGSWHKSTLQLILNRVVKIYNTQCKGQNKYDLLLWSQPLLLTGNVTFKVSTLRRN